MTYVTNCLLFYKILLTTSNPDIIIDISVFIYGQRRFWLLFIHIASKKFMNIFVRASIKSPILVFHVYNSVCRLENFHAYICVFALAFQIVYV